MQGKRSAPDGPSSVATSDRTVPRRRRDQRVHVTQHAFNAYKQARGWAMTGDVAEMDRMLGQAIDLTEAALAQQADAPGNMYW